jgi:hypothetical protein
MSEAAFRRSILGQAPSRSTKIRLGWNGLAGTIILAYYEITYVKSFITFGPGFTARLWVGKL